MVPKLTASGKNLLLRALAGETITFTKIQLGNGTAQDPAEATGLANPIITVELSKIVVGTEYVYHDAYCGDECEYGQIIGMPAKFQAPKELVEKALAAGGDTPVHGGLIVSGEWFVDSKEKMRGIMEHFPNAKAVDMESCSIAQTCHIYHVPFISFRIISDIPLKDDKASQYFDFWARLAEGSFNVTKHFLESI